MRLGPLGNSRWADGRLACPGLICRSLVRALSRPCRVFSLAPLLVTMMMHMLAFLPTGLVAADPEAAPPVMRASRLVRSFSIAWLPWYGRTPAVSNLVACRIVAVRPLSESQVCCCAAQAKSFEKRTLYAL